MFSISKALCSDNDLKIKMSGFEHYVPNCSKEPRFILNATEYFFFKMHTTKLDLLFSSNMKVNSQFLPDQVYTQTPCPMVVVLRHNKPYMTKFVFKARLKPDTYDLSNVLNAILWCANIK